MLSIYFSLEHSPIGLYAASDMSVKTAVVESLFPNLLAA